MPINMPAVTHDSFFHNASFQTFNNIWMLATNSKITTIGMSKMGSRNNALLATTSTENPNPMHPLTMPAKNTQAKKTSKCHETSLIKFNENIAPNQLINQGVVSLIKQKIRSKYLINVTFYDLFPLSLAIKFVEELFSR